MAKSSGIPYFAGNRIAHSAVITDMQASVNPVVKIYPRNIGAVLKGTGAVSKTLTLTCNVIPPTDATRADVEKFMNDFNELHGIKVGTLVIDDNEYLDCGIDTIDYEDFITDGFIKYTIQFNLGVQSETGTVRQLVPSKLFYDTRGRVAQFISESKTFDFLHNVDTVRNLENRLVIELYDKESKDNTIKFNGGVETLKAICWMKATGEDQEDGWRQTVGAYMYNIMNGPLGNRGTFTLGGNTLENILFTGVTLTEFYPTSARYELTFLISLQC